MPSILGFHASGAIIGFGHGLWKGLPVNQLPKRMAGGVTIVFGLYVLQESAFRNMKQQQQYRFESSSSSSSMTADQHSNEEREQLLTKMAQNELQNDDQHKFRGLRRKWRGNRVQRPDAASAQKPLASSEEATPSAGMPMEKSAEQSVPVTKEEK